MQDKTCGTGIQTRSVTCKDNHFCPGAKPATTQRCTQPEKHCGKACDG